MIPHWPGSVSAQTPPPEPARRWTPAVMTKMSFKRYATTIMRRNAEVSYLSTWLLFSPAPLFRLESGKWMWQEVSSMTFLMFPPPFPITWECSVCVTSIFSVTLFTCAQVCCVRSPQDRETHSFREIKSHLSLKKIQNHPFGLQNVCSFPLHFNMRIWRETHTSSQCIHNASSCFCAKLFSGGNVDEMHWVLIGP